MIKKTLLLIAFIVFQQTIISQTKETCDNPIADPFLELNSIAAKCAAGDAEKPKARNLSKKTSSIAVSTRTRRRVVRNRDVATGVSTNTGMSHQIASIKEKASLIGSLDLSNEEVLENVPFNLVEQVPLFKPCQKSAISEQEECFTKEIRKHVRKNFNYPSEAYESNIQGRVFIQFVIDKTGKVDDLRIRGPYKGDLLEAEAERIIKKLPKLKPGKHNGREVKVKYGIPITFKIPGQKPSNIKVITPKSEINNSNIVNFTSVNQIPTFKVCALMNDTSIDCFNREIINHVQKNFTYPKTAIEDKIQGKVITTFIIDKTGNVTSVKTTAPKGCEVLEFSAKKIFEKLPTLTPAKHNGKAVNVKHTFPLDYVLN